MSLEGTSGQPLQGDGAGALGGVGELTRKVPQPSLVDAKMPASLWGRPIVPHKSIYRPTGASPGFTNAGIKVDRPKTLEGAERAAWEVPGSPKQPVPGPGVVSPHTHRTGAGISCRPHMFSALSLMPARMNGISLLASKSSKRVSPSARSSSSRALKHCSRQLSVLR